MGGYDPQIPKTEKFIHESINTYFWELLSLKEKIQLRLFTQSIYYILMVDFLKVSFSFYLGHSVMITRNGSN